LTRIQSTFNVILNHYKAVVVADIVTFVVVVAADAVVVETFIFCSYGFLNLPKY
jgi:hypothetical protein